MSKRIVLGVHAGGLGDHLIYTTLPGLYRASGYDVFISSRTGNGEPFTRNPETRQLLWDGNAAVSAIVDEPPDGPSDRGGPFIKLCKQLNSPIRAMEHCHGFTTPNLYPELGYQPKLLDEWKGAIVADSRSISQPIHPHVFDRFAAELARWYEFDLSRVVVLESKHAGANGAGALAGCGRYVVRDIFEYADIVYSCKYFLVAESGGQVLAAAIKRGNVYPEKVFACFTTRAYNDRIFVFPNVTYKVTGQMSPDYLDYPG
jgi:hypothetical protein